MKNKSSNLLTFFLMTIMLLLPLQVQAAKEPVLNRKKIELTVDDRFKLRPNEQGEWKTSDSAIVRVSNDGTLKAISPGSARIIFTAKKTKRSVTCNVVVKQGKKKGKRNYSVSGNKLKIKYEGKRSRTFPLYVQNSYSSFISSQGCTLTACATVLSGFGKKYNPQQVHDLLEKPAAKKLKSNCRLYGRAAASMELIAEIIKGQNIPIRYVASFTARSAEKDINQALSEGKTVLTECNKYTYNGNRLANSHHAVILYGIDENGYVILSNPKYAAINKDRAGKNIKVTVAQMTTHFMMSRKNTPSDHAYTTSLNAAGGYIVIG